VDGTEKIQKSVKGKLRALSIFLTLDPKEQEARLRELDSEDEAAIQKRLKKGVIERTFAPQYDIRIENTESRDTAIIIAQMTNEMII